MSFKLVYTKRAVKDIRKLDAVAKKRLKRMMERLAEDPFRYSKKLIDPKLGEYRYRVGHFRVIFDLVQNEIVVLRIGHRREIYG